MFSVSLAQTLSLFVILFLETKGYFFRCLYCFGAFNISIPDATLGSMGINNLSCINMSEAATNQATIKTNLLPGQVTPGPATGIKS